MFDSILEQYLASLAATGKSPATRRAVRSDLTQFCTWWERTRQRSFDLTQVVERDLRTWKGVRQQDEGAAPATINRGLSTLRRLCAWAVEQRLLTENPVREVSFQKLNGAEFEELFGSHLCLTMVHQSGTQSRFGVA